LSHLAKRQSTTTTTAGPGRHRAGRSDPRPQPRSLSARSAPSPRPSSSPPPQPGPASLAGDLDELAGLEAAHGSDVLIAALERSIAFGRFRAADVRSILAAGTGLPRPTRPGEALVVDLPADATRPLSAYAIGDGA